MAVTLQQLIDAVHALDEAKGFRLVQVGEAVAADAVVADAQVKAATEHSEADAANLSEDDAISALKILANDYVKEN